MDKRRKRLLSQGEFAQTDKNSHRTFGHHPCRVNTRETPEAQKQDKGGCLALT